jgi:hypothetical protein
MAKKKKQEHPTPRDSEHNKDLPDFWRRNYDYGESPYMHLDEIEKITDKPPFKKKKKADEIIERLMKLADYLDKSGFHEEASEIDGILVRLAKEKKMVTHKTPPKKYRETGAKNRSDYADPENYKYPIHTEENVRAAISYFSKPSNANKYPPGKRSSIWARIRAAAKRYDIKMSDKSGPPSEEKKSKKKTKSKKK